MNCAFDDVPDVPLIVLDLEWIGNSFVPSNTHIVDIACFNTATNATFSSSVQPLASMTTGSTAKCASHVLQEWLVWLQEQSSREIILIAHNGIRFDAPVLLHALRRCSLPVPSNICMMDSLYHLRYHLRYRVPKTMKYDIDSLCTYCNITVETARRHSACYDVTLLHSILMHFSSQGFPFISGRQQALCELSTMLVHGIGPAVAAALPTTGLVSLCESILSRHHNLSAESCAAYFKDLGLLDKLPLCNVSIIAAHVEETAKKHLQYLETSA